MFLTQAVEKINTHTHIMSNKLSFENRAVYENLKKYGTAGRTQTTIWRMRITCWIIKAINTQPEYVKLIVFLQQQWLRERALMSRYTYTACFFNLGIGWRKTVSFITWSFDTRKK